MKAPVDRLGIVATARQLWPQFIAQRNQAIEMDKWVKGKPDLPTLPHATKEYTELQERSVTPWLGMTVNSLSQTMFVEGHRVPKSSENSPLWDSVWQTNGMDSKQIAVHRGALTHGQSYVRVLRGTSPLTGAPAAEVRGRSAKRMAAFYTDEADEYPLWAIEAEKQVTVNERGDRETQWSIMLYDEEQVHFLGADEDGSDMHYIDSRDHDAGVVPVVRFANQLGLDGETMGEVEPFIPLASRIDQDTFDRLIVQRFGAWKVRWIAGMQKPETDEERKAVALALRIEDLLISGDAATKFGTLEGTPMDGYIKARDADIRDLAAVTQTPPHHLLGLSPNLSAEALAAAEASLMRKVSERKVSFGESWEQVMRLAAWVVGDRTSAEDYTSSVRWRDIESRSLAQVADALGKIAVSLKVPVQMLWERLPGWTDDDVAEAKRLSQEEQAELALMAELLGQTEASQSLSTSSVNQGA